MGMGPPLWWWGVGLDESLCSALFGIMPPRSVVKCGWLCEVPNQLNFCFHIKPELIGRT